MTHVGRALEATLGTLLVLGPACVWNRAEAEIHLIQAGYEGPVLIIFDDPRGAPERREDGARVYEIPPSGVLRTRFGPNPGWNRPMYYYIDAIGRRTPIVRGDLCTDPAPPHVVRACRMPEISLSGRPTPPYTSYIVGRDEAERSAHAKWESLVMTEVFADSARARNHNGTARNEVQAPR